MKLIINGFEMDLYEGTRIKQTKQANDIADLDSRQTNFTNKLTLPGTANNVKAFDFLGIAGNQSNTPYQKNVAYLWGDDEELLIHRGWAVPMKTVNNDYNVYLYDGIIDFFKAIENKTLNDLGVEELDHLKNIANVIATWTDLTLPYRYNVADYNGKMVYGEYKLNTDFLIPSASIPYLWEKLFDFIGWTYEGVAFDHTDFTNLWLSYPKPIGESSASKTFVYEHIFTDNELLKIGIPNPRRGPETIDLGFFGEINGNPDLSADVKRILYPRYINGQEDGFFVGHGIYNSQFNNDLLFPNGGLFEFNFSGYLESAWDPSLTDQHGLFYKRYNSENNLVETAQIGTFFNLKDNFDFSVTITTNPNDRVYFEGSVTLGKFPAPKYLLQGNVVSTINKIEGDTVDFSEALTDFSVTDFVKDIMVRLSLTPFPNNTTKHIKFLKHTEIANSNDLEDWSSKYVKRLGEVYIYSNYGQKNRFSYKYNDKESDHNDGFLKIDNINLALDRNAYQSAFYSPEKNKTDILGFELNQYKFWEKEIKDDTSVNYKELDGRFYLMKSKIENSTITVGSELFDQDQQVTFFAVEDYSGLPFNEVITDYYPTIFAMLNRTKVQEILINLSASDIETLDFSKPKYFKQEGAHFILNKVKSWEADKLTVCEFIKIK